MKSTLLESRSEREKRIDELYSKGPVKRGPYYCSPWCGAKCTIVAFDAAGIKAKALADRLGPEWKPRVWENMGWHYAAVTDSGWHMMEDDDRKTKFKDGYGRLYYSLTTGTMHSGTGPSPEQVLRNVLKSIKRERDQLDRLYNNGMAALRSLKNA